MNNIGKKILNMSTYGKITIPTKETFYTMILDENKEIVTMTLFKTIEAAANHYDDIVENYARLKGESPYIFNGASVSYGRLNCYDLYKKEFSK